MPRTSEEHAKRVQVMLTPDEFEFLQEYASAVNMPVEDLVRELLERSVFGNEKRMRKLRALKELFSLEGAPVSDWEEMEREIEARWMEPPETI